MVEENRMKDIGSQKEASSRRALVTAGIIGIGILIILIVFLTRPAASSAFGSNDLLVLVPAAFLAGILSFLSPCTLPILPAYFAFTFQARKQNVVLMTVTFFLGLATTVTVLGASATALSLLLLQNLRYITILGGLLIIAFGVMSFLGKGFTGPQFQSRPATTAVGSYLYGATFAIGWTACIGPILGAILTLLATQGLAVFQGGLLAFIYALGLGSPLILVSTFFSRFGQGSRFWRSLRGKGFSFMVAGKALSLHSTSMISGLLLIVMGVLLASGKLTLFTQLASGSDLSLWVIEMEERLGSLLGW
jgi:cytochrome c-type biogenesis protein